VSDLAQAVERREADETEIERRARDLIEFADGLDDTGLHRTAGRCRIAADDLLRILADVRAERAARVKIQADRDRCLTLLADRAGQAALRGSR
jgi:hypothetical protein